eukprot:6189592-Pleurochrysis_carterae.AAC.6
MCTAGGCLNHLLELQAAELEGIEALVCGTPQRHPALAPRWLQTCMPARPESRSYTTILWIVSGVRKRLGMQRAMCEMQLRPSSFSSKLDALLSIYATTLRDRSSPLRALPCALYALLNDLCHFVSLAFTSADAADRDAALVPAKLPGPVGRARARRTQGFREGRRRDAQCARARAATASRAAHAGAHTWCHRRATKGL